jgi:hypothetical protein
MGKSRSYRAAIVALLLVGGFSLLAVGCFGGGGTTATTESLGQVGQPTSVATSTTVDTSLTLAENNGLSTFRSKDPFIQQAVSTTVTTSGGSTGTTGKGPTTTFRPGGSSTTTTTLHGGGSTTTAGPTSSTTTTAPHLHTLKILSIGTVGGAPAVTFQVDGSSYQNARVGNVVSTSWGQIKVLDINTSSKVVTLLQGSETLVLTVGQLVFE